MECERAYDMAVSRCGRKFLRTPRLRVDDWAHRLDDYVTKKMWTLHLLPSSQVFLELAVKSRTGLYGQLSEIVPILTRR